MDTERPIGRSAVWAIRALLFLSVKPSFPLKWAKWLCPVHYHKHLDCIFIQAFGRGKFLDKEVSPFLNQYRTADGKIDEGQIFQRLDEAGFKPGKSNDHLAQIAYEQFVSQNPEMVVIAQWEVVCALRRTYPEWFKKAYQDKRIELIWPDISGYLATVHVKAQSVQIMEGRGLAHPVELSHHCMIARAFMILWKLGQRPHLFITDVSWDPDSVQKWTRSPKAWWKRELLLSVPYHIVKGWLAFSPPKSAKKLKP